jgi:altronate dehydratase large subunit
MFFGYERPNGSVGIRNRIGIISLMDNANGLALKIHQNVRETDLVTDLFGRKMIGRNHEMRLKAIHGMAMNPNIAGVVLVSLHNASTDAFAGPIAEAGKDVECVPFQDYGSTFRAIEAGTVAAAKLVRKHSTQQRTEQPFSKLVFGVECGGSDFSSGLSGNPALGHAADLLMDAGGSVVLSETAEIMGAEHLLAERAVNKEVAEKIVKAIADMEEMSRMGGVEDIRRTNPSADNIAGGLTTLAEKALGAVKKAGTKPLQGVVDYCEPVIPEPPGFYFMSTPAPACESMTGFAAGGCQVIGFNTGLGQPSSHPFTPTIKISGNPLTASRAFDDLDVDVSKIMTGEMSIEEGGKLIYEELMAVINGRRTFTELFDTGQSTIGVAGASF